MIYHTFRSHFVSFQEIFAGKLAYTLYKIVVQMVRQSAITVVNCHDIEHYHDNRSALLKGTHCDCGILL